MQPVGQSTPVPVEAVTKSHLETAPIEIKLMILKGLDITEIPSIALINKSWAKVSSDKRLWVQVAKQQNAPVANDPKMEVLNFHYESICKVIDDYSLHMDREGYWAIIKDLKADEEDPKSKYALALKHFKTRKDSFRQFLNGIFANPITSNEIRAIKQFVENGVLSSDEDTMQDLNEVSMNYNRNFELFKYLFSKLPNDIPTVDKALENLARNGPDTLPFLKFLIEKGARPTVTCLINAAETIEIQDGGTKHLEFLLDYCETSLREQVVKKFNGEICVYFPVCTNREKSIPIIQEAPPPTFGKQQG